MGMFTSIPWSLSKLVMGVERIVKAAVNPSVTHPLILGLDWAGFPQAVRGTTGGERDRYGHASHVLCSVPMRGRPTLLEDRGRRRNLNPRSQCRGSHQWGISPFSSLGTLPYAQPTTK